jgi:hypothetical protein
MAGAGGAGGALGGPSKLRIRCRSAGRASGAAVYRSALTVGAGGARGAGPAGGGPQGSVKSSCGAGEGHTGGGWAVEAQGAGQAEAHGRPLATCIRPSGAGHAGRNTGCPREGVVRPGRAELAGCLGGQWVKGAGWAGGARRGPHAAILAHFTRTNAGCGARDGLKCPCSTGQAGRHARGRGEVRGSAGRARRAAPRPLQAISPGGARKARGVRGGAQGHLVAPRSARHAGC